MILFGGVGCQILGECSGRAQPDYNILNNKTETSSFFNTYKDLGQKPRFAAAWLVPVANAQVSCRQPASAHASPGAPSGPLSG